MKTLEEIDRLTLDDLQKVSFDTSVEVPESLDGNLDEMIDSMAKTSAILGEDPGRQQKVKVKRLRLIVSAAAAVILIAGFGIAYFTTPDKPADTFTDPELAYAQVEKVLSKLSDTVDESAQKASETAVFVSEHAKKQ